ncbi:MAG: TIGR03747 family integrating conjugative element membrane protein [Candidatus Accumulibacter sp.]|nr:TIGR03747 family integrating conjugative element membrane protein [Accumulibacter sp.]
MSDPAAASRAPPPPQSLLAKLVLLPFHLFGVLCGSLLLSITVECLGVAFFWADEGERHARDMLRYELGQLSENFTRSLLLRAPGPTARELVEWAYDGLFVKSGLSDGLHEASVRAGQKPARFRDYLRRAAGHAQTYLVAAAYTVLVFLVRLMVLALSVPLFLTAALAGLVDGLVRRDLRRFGAGRESGFVYHRARAALMPLATLPWVIYLALPVSVSPLGILLPGAILLGAATCVAAATFKKYL